MNLKEISELLNKYSDHIETRPGVLYENYDYVDQSKSEKENTKSGPGGGLYDGNMGKYKSVKDFIDADRKRKRKQRKNKLAFISTATETISIPEDVLHDGNKEEKEEDENGDEIFVDNTINGIPFTNKIDPYPTYDASFAQPVGQLFDNDQMHNSYYGLYSLQGSTIDKSLKLAELYLSLIKNK